MNASCVRASQRRSLQAEVAWMQGVAFLADTQRIALLARLRCVSATSGMAGRALSTTDPPGGAAPRPAGRAVGVPTPRLAALDWDQVRVFLAVARAGQLAGAAARLGLDVSTVSRRIDRLEAELGVHLFDRTREGTVATAAAEAMLPAAEDMERGLAMFAAAVDAIETTAEGLVRM